MDIFNLMLTRMTLFTAACTLLRIKEVIWIHVFILSSVLQQLDGFIRATSFHEKLNRAQSIFELYPSGRLTNRFSPTQRFMLEFRVVSRVLSCAENVLQKSNKKSATQFENFIFIIAAHWVSHVPHSRFACKYVRWVRKSDAITR